MIGHRTASRRTLRYVVVPTIAFAATAGLIWRASYAAFDPSTSRSADAPGQVTLTDDAHGSALFHPGGPVVPGAAGTQCVKVTSTAGDAGSVRMYLTDLVGTTNGFQNHMMITVEQGRGSGTGSCVGFVADAAGQVIPRQSFAAAAEQFADFESGAGDWATHGNTTGESMSYKVTWEFDTTGMSQAAQNSLMGEQTGLRFEWELQSV